MQTMREVHDEIRATLAREFGPAEAAGMTTSVDMDHWFHAHAGRYEIVFQCHVHHPRLDGRCERADGKTTDEMLARFHLDVMPLLREAVNGPPSAEIREVHLAEAEQATECLTGASP